MDPEREVHLPPDEVISQAGSYAAGLATRGVKAGDRVAILAQTTPEILLSFMGCWQLGGVAVPLPLPMRAVSPTAFLTQTMAKVKASGARLVVVPEGLMGFVSDLEAGCPIVSAESLARGADTCPAVEVDPSAVALLQFTSGSTSEPRGVVLTHANLLANVSSIVRRISLSRTTTS